jgi:hypothetical protein
MDCRVKPGNDVSNANKKGAASGGELPEAALAAVRRAQA